MVVQTVKIYLILLFVIFCFGFTLGQDTQQGVIPNTGVITQPSGKMPIIPHLAPNKGVQQQEAHIQYQGLPTEQQYANQQQAAMFSNQQQVDTFSNQQQAAVFSNQQYQSKNGDEQQDTRVMTSNTQYVNPWQPTNEQQQQRDVVYTDNNNNYYYDNTQQGYYSNSQQGYYGNDQQYFGNQMYDSPSIGVGSYVPHGSHPSMERYGTPGYGSHIVPYNHYVTQSYHPTMPFHYGQHQSSNSVVSDVLTLLLLTRVIRG